MAMAVDPLLAYVFITGTVNDVGAVHKYLVSDLYAIEMFLGLSRGRKEPCNADNRFLAAYLPWAEAEGVVGGFTRSAHFNHATSKTRISREKAANVLIHCNILRADSKIELF